VSNEIEYMSGKLSKQYWRCDFMSLECLWLNERGKWLKLKLLIKRQAERKSLESCDPISMRKSVWEMLRYSQMTIW
jgi:hypothetical protein